MDPRTFDRMIQRLSSTRSRRSLVGGSLGSAVLIALGWGQEAGGKKRTVKAEDKLGIGARCDPSNNEHGKRHGCRTCRTEYSVKTTNGKGKTIRKCACKPVGKPSSRDKQWQCCSGLSDGSHCVNAAGATVPVCPAVCPVCQTCHPAAGVCAVDASENGEAGTGCAPPKVCCGGTCCDSPIRECTDAGACKTCAQKCPGCARCFHLIEGNTVCSGSDSGTTTGTCQSSDECPDTHPNCVLTFTDAGGNTTQDACLNDPPGVGCCYRISPCT